MELNFLLPGKNYNFHYYYCGADRNCTGWPNYRDLYMLILPAPNKPLKSPHLRFVNVNNTI